MSLEICYEEGRLKVAVNEENTPWNLTSYPSPIEDVIAALKNAREKGEFIDARLYSYDRYGLGTQDGFHKLLKDYGTSNYQRTS